MEVGEGEAAGRTAGTEETTSVQRFLDMSIDLLGILDLQTNILEVSQSWETTLGWPRAEVMGTPLVRYFHEDDLPRVEAELAELLVGGDAVAVVVRLMAADGSYRWVQGNARADLHAERIYVTAADITERKQLEDALLVQVALEELVAAITAQLIASPDDQVAGVIERGIGELAQAMGADRAHFLRGGRQPEDITHVEWLHPDTGQPEGDPDPRVTQWWLETARSGRLVCVRDIGELAEEVPEVAAALRADGVRSVLHVPLPVHRRYWGFVALVAIQDHVVFNEDAAALLRLAGEAFMTVMDRGDDAAALLDARRELEHRNEELERSNEDLAGFAFAAAHDLKAPLARIEMALAATAPEVGEAGPLLEVARRAAGRMRRLIEDLLTFASVGSRPETAETVDLDEVLAQVLGDLAPAISASGARVTAAPLPVVWGFPTLLEQLLQNLVGNSLKFTRPGVAPVIEISAITGVDGVTLRVADNGIGVEPDQRNQVFGVFSRLHTSEQFEGSGIGLATCAKVVSVHGGRISLGDGIDGGLSVVVWLPPRPGDP